MFLFFSLLFCCNLISTYRYIPAHSLYSIPSSSSPISSPLFYLSHTFIHIVYSSYSCSKLHAAWQSPYNRILTFPDGYGDSKESFTSSCCISPSSFLSPFSPHPPLCAVRGQERDRRCVCFVCIWRGGMCVFYTMWECVCVCVCVCRDVSLQAVYTSLEFSTDPRMASVVSHQPHTHAHIHKRPNISLLLVGYVCVHGCVQGRERQ